MFAKGSSLFLLGLVSAFEIYIVVIYKNLGVTSVVAVVVVVLLLFQRTTIRY